MRSKCRTMGEIAVTELADAGARTQATVVTEKVHKKRRRSNDDVEEAKVISSTASYIQLRNRRILVDHHHHHHRDENRFLSSNSDHDDDVSCCSSNSRSCEKRIIELSDLEGESIEVEESPQFSTERRETTPSSEARAEKPENLDPTSSTPSTPPEENSGRRSTGEKMPSEAEIEEFFAAAEKKLQKEFAEKYNYDIVKDEPLEGRFEWVGLKP